MNYEDAFEALEILIEQVIDKNKGDHSGNIRTAEAEEALEWLEDICESEQDW